MSTPKYKIHLLMIRKWLSKSFDRVERSRVIEVLKTILEKDKQHLVKIPLEGVKLTIRIGNQMWKVFNTNIKTPQGDYLSPILFTFYFAEALRGEPMSTNKEEVYKQNHRELAPHIRDHMSMQRIWRHDRSFRCNTRMISAGWAWTTRIA